METSAAEVVEGRPVTKENTIGPNMCLTQIRESVSQGQYGVRRRHSPTPPDVMMPKGVKSKVRTGMQ